VLDGQLKRAKEGPAALVFLGDSLVQGWSEQPRWKDHCAKLGAVNFGVGGDGTPHMLYRIDKGILDGLAPKVVVLSAGVNNVWPGFDAADTIKGLRTVVEAIQRKAPTARTIVMSNFHFFDQGDGGTRRRVDTINAALKALADGSRIRYVDVSRKFLLPSGELDMRLYTSDKIHLTAEGYKVWAESLDPVLAELLN
jgi:lysophospholipase L1-like esterase